MKVRIRVLAMLLVLPALAMAQRGGGRGGGGRGGAAAPPPDISKGDIEKFDAAKFFLGKRKDLKLEKGQVAALDTLERSVKPALGQLASRFDTLQQNYDELRDSVLSGGGGRGARRGRGTGDAATSGGDQRSRMLAARQLAIGALLDVQRVNDSSSVGVLRVLTDSQRVKANALLVKRNADLLKMLSRAGFTSAPAGASRRG